MKIKKVVEVEVVTEGNKCGNHDENIECRFYHWWESFSGGTECRLFNCNLEHDLRCPQCLKTFGG